MTIRKLIFLKETQLVLCVAEVSVSTVYRTAMLQSIHTWRSSCEALSGGVLLSLLQNHRWLLKPLEQQMPLCNPLTRKSKGSDIETNNSRILWRL